MDDVSGRLNTDGHGKLLGNFDTGEQLLVLFNDGSYEVRSFEINEKMDLGSIIDILKFTPDLVISAIHFDPEREATYVKRFNIETTTLNKRYSYLNNESSKFLFATLKLNPVVEYAMRVGRKKMTGELDLTEFIEVKGWKAIGNKFSDNKLYNVELIKFDEPKVEERMEQKNENNEDSADEEKTLFD
jgi:topoisomerase-4 subunit A